MAMESSEHLRVDATLTMITQFLYVTSLFHLISGLFFPGIMASLAYLIFRNLCRQIRHRSIYSGPEDMATVHYPLHFFTNRSDLAGEKGEASDLSMYL